MFILPSVRIIIIIIIIIIYCPSQFNIDSSLNSSTLQMHIQLLLQRLLSSCSTCHIYIGIIISSYNCEGVRS